MDDAPVGSRVE